MTAINGVRYVAPDGSFTLDGLRLINGLASDLPTDATADQFLGWNGTEWRPATITPTTVDGGIDLVVLFNNGVI